MRAGVIAMMALAGCETAPDPTLPPLDFSYDGVETILLDGDLVNFRVQMTNAFERKDITDYAECAAAQYTLIRGFGFARQVRTQVNEEGGIWTGDAVYTISPALPRGPRTIDAEVVVAECERRGIPTV